MNPNRDRDSGGASRAAVVGFACIVAVAVGGALWVSNSLAIGSSDASLEARRERIADMSAAEKEQLRIKQERFAKLDESERERLRALHAAIEKHPRCDELERLTMRYRQWLRELTPEDRAVLLTTDVSERLAVVQSLQEKLHQRYLAEAGKEMSKDDVEAVRHWMDEFAASRVAKALDASDGWEKRGLEKAIERKDHGSQRQIVWHMIFRGKIPPPNEDDHQRLADSLSPERRQTFDRAKTKDERGRVVNAWIGGTMSFRRGWGGPSHEDLQEELEKLTKEERQRISTLPPEQMRDALRRKWFESRFNRGRPGGRGERGSSGRGAGDRGRDSRPPGSPGRSDRDDNDRDDNDRGDNDRGDGDRDGDVREDGERDARRSGERRGRGDRESNRDDEPADQSGDQSGEPAADRDAASVRRALIRTYGAT